MTELDNLNLELKSQVEQLEKKIQELQEEIDILKRSYERIYDL